MIKNKINRSFIFLFVVVSTLNAFGEKKAADSEAFNPTPQILHHIADSYEWHLWGNVSIPLPVILYSEGNWDIFMSSAFHHGKSKVFKGVAPGPTVNPSSRGMVIAPPKDLKLVSPTSLI